MTAADPRAAMLDDLTEGAYRLGKAFMAAAEQAQGTDKWLDYFHAFDRCFFSVRVAIALQLRLRHQPKDAREPVSDRETLTDREDPVDRDDSDPRYTERDRDRETERASFPILIRALEGVVADAAALPGPEPAALPNLRELLARVKAQSPPVAAAPQPALARLDTSGAAPTAAPERRPASNVAEVLARRTARPARPGAEPLIYRSSPRKRGPRLFSLPGRSWQGRG